jgi:hypothetical protein
MVGQGEGLRALQARAGVRSGDPRGSASHLFVEPARMDGLEHERFEAVPVRPPCAEESFGLDALRHDRQALQAAQGTENRKKPERNEQQTGRCGEHIGARHRTAGEPMEDGSERQKSQ